MEERTLKIGIIGRTEPLLSTIQEIVNSNHEIVFIITCKAQPEYSKNEDDFKNFAAKHSIPFILAEKINLNETINWIKNKPADICLSVNWKTVIGSDVRNLFKHGIINAHPGNLPKYRGNAVTNWAIIQGDDKIVLTLHQMDEGLDSGPILAKADIPIGDNTFIKDTIITLNNITPKLFLKVLDEINRGVVSYQIQEKNIDSILRCYPRIPSDSEINWNDSAINIERLIRASSEPYSGAYTFLENKKITIWKARTEKISFKILGTPGQVVEVHRDKNEVAVLSGDGFLVIQLIQLENNNKTEPTQILKSARMRLGMNYSTQIIELNNKINYLESLLNKKYDKSKKQSSNA